MSLLMKALEKAAKDRGDARTEQPAAPAKTELALEPIAAPAPKPELPARPAAAAPAPRPEVPTRPAAAPPRPAPAAAPPAARPAPPSAPEREQEQASTILQAQAASRPAAGSVGAYIRARPVMAIGTVAAVFAAGFGVYVYLQIFNPGFFVGQPVVVAKGPPPVLKPPAPAPGTPAPGEPLATETVLKEAAAESAAATGATQRPTAPTPAPEEPAARGNTIVVSPGSAEPVLNPLLGQAYAALQAGQSDTAQRLYGDLLRSEPRNVDALLGLAAMAGQRGNTEEAVRLYLQILELDPRHALAQSGLIALLGRADPLAAESKLRQLIAREPSAWLYFTLGNLYADQSLWAAAQQAYFQAHHLEPGNPDYAYNLAVGLEHVSQPKLALGFYRRAVELAAARGRANFNLALVRERVGKLAQQVE